MSPSNSIFDRNLSGLLRRSWRPARPTPEFAARLERALAPWIEEEARTRSRPGRRAARGPRRLLAAALAAAAALLLWFAVFSDGTDPGGGSPRRGLRGLLADGAVAVRFERGGEWFLAAEPELERVGRLESGYAELATPSGSGVEVRGEEGWAVVLRASARLFVEDREARLRFTLLSGGALLSQPGKTREVDAPAVLDWYGGEFHDPRETRPRATAGEGGAPGRESVELAGVVEEDASPVEEDGAEPATDLAALVGTVREGDDGHAVPEFEVTLLKAAAPPQVALPNTRTFQDPRGSFRWDALRPGRYTVFVQAPGRAVEKYTDLDLRAGEERVLEVSLDAGGALRGFVVDRESGAAIEGALVISERDMPMQVISMTTEEFFPEARAFTFSAADGSFELPRMSAGRHQVRAGRAGFGCSWIESPPVRVGEVTDGLLLELGPGGSVTGRIRRPDGSPWVAARVVVSRYSGSGELSTMSYQAAATDERGEYYVRDLAPGVYVVLCFGDGGLEESDFQPEFVPVRVEAGATLRADFPVRADGASLSGFVRDGEGMPVPRANVYLFTEGSGDSWTADTTGEDGRYAIDGLEAGSYYLQAGIGQSNVRIGAITLRDGEEETLDGVLDGRALEVRVTEAASGRPLTDAKLLLFSAHEPSRSAPPGWDTLVAWTWLGTDGVYRFDDLPEGQYLLLAASDRGTWADAVIEDVRVAADGGDERLAISLERAGRARIRVADGAGAPLAGAAVELIHPHGASWPFSSADETDAEGVAAEARLLPGRWTAIVKKPGYLDRTVAFEVAPEREIEVPVVLLER